MEITFKGRQTDVATRFRDQATAKLSRLEKLDQKAIRVDVEVSVERNPRQSSQKERVELTIVSRGPAIRAEAAAEDRFAALDLALAKLDARLRRALDRRKRRHIGHAGDRISDRVEPDQLTLPETMAPPARSPAVPRQQSSPDDAPRSEQQAEPGTTDSVVPIDMDGDGPLVVRQKFHHATPISIDQALLEMELVGHDFYLFHDIDEDVPSVVYRRRGYQYGVIRLVEVTARSSSGQRIVASGAPPASVPAGRSPLPSSNGSGALAAKDSQGTATPSG
jgi:ribosomal subunit interface protein